MNGCFVLKDQEALKRLECSLCRKLLKEAVQPSCGHRLCQSCADEIVKKRFPPKCPQEDCEKCFLIMKNGVYVSPPNGCVCVCCVCVWGGGDSNLIIFFHYGFGYS